MKKLHFDDYKDFVIECDEKLRNVIDSDKYNSVSIIALYKDARKIVKEFCCEGYELRSVEIHDEEFDGYCDEYIVSVDNIDGYFEVWCEPMIYKYQNRYGYLKDESTVCYILDNCSSEVYNRIESSDVYEVGIECEECLDKKKDLCSEDSDFYVGNNEPKIKYDNDENGNTHGFSVSKSDENSSIFYSYYTTDNLDKDDICDLLKIFDM